ncbi:hypothetical protein [Halococcoides cellulosivorans]|uniref:Uncharacterized protein n=1 Tax=Halococcoides cellulosivorans TaxID=1679096 RepID=A0A2R4X2W1_9EURY|nr:hypothetical protein [Halococcoides cellulosivorans]AWB28149.1 hypothetical protein HARCEL1_10750 [Halococcoides cellulosivorans]
MAWVVVSAMRRLTDRPEGGHRIRGRLYAACFVVLTVPFVVAGARSIAGGSTTVTVLGSLAVPVFAVGVYGLINPRVLGVQHEEGALVAIALLAVVYAVVL